MYKLYRCYLCEKTTEEITLISLDTIEIGFAQQEQIIPVCAMCFKRKHGRRIEVF